MKLLKQITLLYQQGTSEKVYEVDLCEVGDGQYVVNYRFGRRGGVLRDGTKTTLPVTREQADGIFQRLVDKKLAGGYRRAGEAPAAASSTAQPAERASGESDPRIAAILARLAAGHDRSKRWKLSRAVWRAGEMRLHAAAPLLAGLLGSGDDMLDYSLLWTLGRSGDTSHVPAIERALDARKRSDMVRRIARFARLEVLQGEERQRAIDRHAAELPTQLEELALRGPPERFQQALRAHLKSGTYQDFAALDTAYLINNEHTRPAILHIVQHAQLQPSYFQRLRHIFKMAEFRGDAQIFGLLVRRFDTTLANISYRLSRNRKVRKKDAKVAYGDFTRVYFRRRSWRTLKRLGDLGQDEYVRLAVGVLLAFSDDDALEPTLETRYDYSNYNWRTGMGAEVTRHHLDQFAPYWAFNQILYGNSTRYEANAKRLTFRCVDGYRPGDAPPAEREEAFPELWEENPAALLHLLDDSRCLVVHEFAVKALQDCREFLAELDLDALVMLLDGRYAVTAQFGFELARERYDAAAPELSLVLAVANCGYDPGRQQARQWIEAGKQHFCTNAGFVASLIASRQPDTRTFARELLRTYAIGDDLARNIITRLVAWLMRLGSDEADRARDIGDTLLLVFPTPLRTIGANIIGDLLSHELPVVQKLAGELVLRHETLSATPPPEVIEALLGSTEADVRAVGVRIIGGLPDTILRDSESLLVALTAHERDDVRAEVRPIVQRLVRGDANFARRMADRLIERLLVPGAPEGAPTHVSQVLREDFADHLAHVPVEMVWKLLQLRSTPAQEVGGVLLVTHVRADDLEVDELVRLADHDILTVRDSAWQLIEQSVLRLQNSMGSTVRLLDAKWDDARRRAMEFFQQHLGRAQLAPPVLVAICDNTREDVQQFGRQLITRHFAEEDGPEFLQKFSEHPARSMQQFASSYLQRYAADHPERLRSLQPYFIAVLSQVNRGRVAKDRVLALLEAEAAKSEEAARVAAEVLARQSATCAIGDRGRAIEIMTHIRRRYPHIEQPLVQRPVEVRGGV